MPGLWVDNPGSDIITKNKIFAELPVEKKNKVVFGMIPGDPFECFVYEPTGTINSVFDQ